MEVISRFAVATKLSQDKKDLRNPKYIMQHSTRVLIVTVVASQLGYIILINEYHIIHVQRYQVLEKELLTVGVYCVDSRIRKFNTT